MELSQSAQAAVADLEKKQGRRAKWAKIGGTLVVIAAALRFVTAVVAGPELKTCGDDTIRDTLSSIIGDALKTGGSSATLTAIGDATTRSRTDSVAKCSARATFSDGSGGMVDYTVTPKSVVIDKIAT